MRSARRGDRNRRRPRGAPSSAHPHRRRRVLIATGVAAGLLLIVFGLVTWWWSARGPGRASIEDAVDRFNTDPGSARAARVPEPGVYVYTSTGEERLSFLSTHQSQDGDLPATVAVRADGCFDFTIEYNSFHAQRWTRCPSPDGWTERGNTTDQKFDFGPLSEDEHTRVDCSPPTRFPTTGLPGSTTPVRCTGFSETTDTTQRQRGTVTLVGPTTVRVGSARVPALHYRQVTRISGEQQGASREQLWLRASDGLPLRESRRIRVISPAPAPLNEVTYTERGEWRLSSLRPRS